MAASQTKVEGSDVQLKHLGFVRILAIHAVVVVSNLYDYAKQNSGPLKSHVKTVENAVTAVVGPVYEKFKGVPGGLLVFFDKKVDQAANKFDECAPPAAKKAVSQGQVILKKASQVAQDLFKEAQVAGPLASLSHAITMSKDLAVSQLAIVWYKVNQYPSLHGVTEMAVPTAAHWSEKYNKFVKDMAARGYGAFNYIPLIPVEEMAKAYKQVEAAVHKKSDTGSSSGSDSDKE